MSFLSERLQLHIGDITKVKVDAIVNAANSSLRGGGGVDGAIHRRAGPALLEECVQIGGCPAGEARITKGHSLPAKYVIHTVGPVYEGGGQREAEVLASCYQASLKLAEEHGVETMAFPCISTGAYGYPKSEACEVAVNTVLEWVQQNPRPHQVIFCCYSEEDAAVYRKRLQEIANR